MKTTLNFRSVVFQRAYRIVKETGCSMSAALVEAWKRYREYRDRTVKELADRINYFDYDYMYSDDGGVYRMWSNIQSDIREKLSALPGFFINAIAGKLKYRENIKSFIKS